MANVDLLSIIYNSAFSDEVKDTVFRQCRSKEFWLQDSDGLDVMHHAILANNHEWVSLLSKQLTESFDEILETKLCAGYLHLAAVLGNEKIVTTLCEGSLVNIGENSCAVHWPHIDVIQRCLTRSDKYSGESGRNLEELVQLFREVSHHLLDDPLLSIIDIAAMGNHIACVRAILKSSVVHYAVKCSTLLERALELGSIVAFRLLLAQNPDSSEVNASFQTALAQRQLHFVAALLDHGLDVSEALDGINPYHFIYLLSLAFGRQRITAVGNRYVSGIDKLTALLIERGFDVNTCDPPGTFPLYSLLASIIQEKDYNPGSIPVCHIQSLHLLLRAGATTDVDEICIARAMNIEPTSLSAEVGRELASSALNAYIYGLQGSDTWRPHIAEYLDRICLSLLEHGANASAIQTDTCSTALHSLMQATATQHAQGHMHADLSTMSRMLLYFGADPNAKNSEGQCPVEIYFVVLLRLMGGLIAFRRWKASNNASQVIHLFYFMDTGEACVVRRRIIDMLISAQRDGMPNDVVQFVESLMDTYVCTIKSLQELAKLSLWKAVNRRMSTIRQIHMPKAFVTGIAELFNLDL